MDIPTYPARPVKGGPYHVAPDKPEADQWFYEPKVNGWRVLVNVKAKKMWNRHGAPSSIEHKFQPALDQLASVFKGGHDTWLDCEALGLRALGAGLGSLVVFDVCNLGADVYTLRQEILDLALQDIVWPWAVNARPAQDVIYRLPRVGWSTAGEMYDNLQAANTALGLELYEGVVAKHGAKPYPVQRRSSTTPPTDAAGMDPNGAGRSGAQPNHGQDSEA